MFRILIIVIMGIWIYAHSSEISDKLLFDCVKQNTIDNFKQGKDVSCGFFKLNNKVYIYDQDKDDPKISYFVFKRGDEIIDVDDCVRTEIAVQYFNLKSKLQKEQELK